MTGTNRINSRILAIAPSSQGFGFAVLEGEEKLVDWGVKRVSGDKNTQSLLKVAELIAYYLPAKLVVEDCSTKGCRRSPRIRTLIQQVKTLAHQRKLAARALSRMKVNVFLCPSGTSTKHDVADILAKRFSRELGHLLPPKRRPWMSEDGRMDIFDAVSLGLAFFCCAKRRACR